jgi:thiol:disulfide interchange protein
MKIIAKAISLLVLGLALAACNTSAPVPTVTIPTSIPATNTPQPTAAAAATATLPTTQIATEAPVDIHAPYNKNAVPAADIANALAQSKNDGKLVLLDFGANWCPDCLVLTTLFEDPAVKPFLAENYHVVRIDIGMGDKNLDVSQKYGNPIEKGIPAVVVLTPNGEIIATTKDGSLANARTATAQEILGLLKTWLAQKP